MTKLKDLQHEAATLLTPVHTAVAVVPVVEDKGTQVNETAYADALENKGAVIVVGVPFDGKLASQSSGTAKPISLLDVSFSVLVQVDSVRNTVSSASPAGLNADIFQLVQDVADALCAFTTVNPNDRYKLSSEMSLSLDRFDAALWSYQLTFVKRCAL